MICICDFFFFFFFIHSCESLRSKRVVKTFSHTIFCNLVHWLTHLFDRKYLRKKIVQNQPKGLNNPQSVITVNVEIFAQYIFSRISRRALDARKFDVSENYYHNRTNRIN